MIDSPVMYILQNTETKRFHPLALKKVPMMGIQLKSDPDRWKSIGHHTVGFKTVEEARKDILSHCKDLASNQMVFGPIHYDLNKVVVWDGIGNPVVNAILNMDEFTLYKSEEENVTTQSCDGNSKE